jgi:hypothetical protein
MAASTAIVNGHDLQYPAEIEAFRRLPEQSSDATAFNRLSKIVKGAEPCWRRVVRVASQQRRVGMFYTDGKLQYPVRVENPDLLFAGALQQAIGGVEGEIRVAIQYFFQACGARGNPKFRDLLMNTAVKSSVTSKCSRQRLP